MPEMPKPAERMTTQPPRATNVSGLLSILQRHSGVAAWLDDAARGVTLGEATPTALDVVRPARAALIAATATAQPPDTRARAGATDRAA